MAARKLHIAPNLKLDPDYVGGGTFALLAKKGAGKSYTARVLAEEFWKASIPFVLLDPMGTSWGLRSSADGKKDGIPVAIFGGAKGDAPLERGGGALMADLVVDEGLSMVLDMSALGSRAAERQFALEFFERLYRRNSELVHLLIDEADLFAPQKPQAGDRQLLGVTENIIRRGRNRGIGITLITQRPAVLNKDVLTQVDGLVPMRITGLTDRQAIDAWVAGHGDDPELAKEVKGTLAALNNGECWWWVPELGILKRVQVRKSETFDSSPTRKRGQKSRGPKGFADVDMGAIEKRMADTIERAKAEDPKELRKDLAVARKRISELESDLKKAPDEAPSPDPIEVPRAPEGAAKRVKDAAAAADQAISAAKTAKALADEVHDELKGLDEAAKQAQAKSAPPQRQRPAQPARDRSQPTIQQPNGRANEDGEVVLNRRAERQILAALIQHPDGLTTRQLAVTAGYAMKGGGFTGALSKLRTHGLITPARVEPIRVTDEGTALMPDVDQLPTGPALLEHWLNQMKRRAEREILQVVYDAYPNALELEEIAARAGYEASGGGFTGAVSKLRTLQLVEGRGELRANDDLFLD